MHFLNISDEEVFNYVNNSENIVFTGGEPLLKENIKEILYIIETIPDKNYEIETNGTIFLDKETYSKLYKTYMPEILFNISPKNNIAQEKLCDTEPVLIKQLQEKGFNFIVKYLFENEKDIIFIRKEQEKRKLYSNQIWVQPVGIGYNEIKTKINLYFDYIIKEGWNISPRTHILLFGNRRNK